MVKAADSTDPSDARSSYRPLGYVTLAVLQVAIGACLAFIMVVFIGVSGFDGGRPTARQSVPLFIGMVASALTLLALAERSIRQAPLSRTVVWRILGVILFQVGLFAVAITGPGSRYEL